MKYETCDDIINYCGWTGYILNAFFTGFGQYVSFRDGIMPIFS